MTLDFPCHFHLPPVAKTAKQCQVGPNSKERAKDQPSWHSKSFQDSSSSSIYQSNIRKRNRDGSPAKSNSTDTFGHAIGTFLSSGCCVIEDALSQNFVKNAFHKATQDLELLEEELGNLRQKAIQQQNTNLLAQVGRGDFRELVFRDGGRRDVRFQLDRFPFSAQGLVYNPIIFPLVKALLGGGDICLLYAGVMWAKPNNDISEPQKWHGDGGHLFDHTDLPPHCINVFYPLVDLSTENGCTEFVPGSHRLRHFDSTIETTFGLCCKIGGAVLFDYRLKHRGGSNISQEPRPVLYLAYSKPFFRDTGNIRSESSLIYSKSISSPPWVSRMLPGEASAVKMGQGFEIRREGNRKDNDNIVSSKAASGSGERWVLFRMNVEIPGFRESKTITVHHGEVAREVSSQFCKKHALDESFISVLQGAIQQQMDDVTTQNT
jgi:ectoine hydroxylase-related dioxygenase (phytanoyl-CoA dioxygenase family)